MKKKIIAIVMVVLTMFINIANLNVAAKAQADTDIICVEASVTCEPPVLRDMTKEELQQIKNGEIRPVVIENLEEYIKNMGVGTTDITNRVRNIPSISPYATMSSKKTIGVDPIPVPPVYINCQFTYTTATAPAGYEYFATVSNITSWLTGVQFPVSYTWSQNSSSKEFTTTKRHVTITINGVLNTHLFVENVGQILSQNRSYSFSFDTL